MQGSLAFVMYSSLPAQSHCEDGKSPILSVIRGVRDASGDGNNTEHYEAPTECVQTEVS